MLSRSSNHLLTSLVQVVLSLSYSTASRYTKALGSRKYLHLLIRIYVYLAFLPIEQIQCNKSLWITWIEIGHAMIENGMSQVLQEIYSPKWYNYFRVLGLILPFAV